MTPLHQKLKTDGRIEERVKKSMKQRRAETKVAMIKENWLAMKKGYQPGLKKA